MDIRLLRNGSKGWTTEEQTRSKEKRNHPPVIYTSKQDGRDRSNVWGWGHGQEGSWTKVPSSCFSFFHCCCGFLDPLGVHSLYERGTESPVASTGTGFGRGRQDHHGRAVLGVTIVVVVVVVV